MDRRAPVTSPDDSATDDHSPEPALRSLPPRTPYEDAVIGILGDILGCRDVDVHDGLLALGDVARIPRVVAQIRRTTGVDIPVADYIEARTVAGLASAVAARSLAVRSTHRPQPLVPRPPAARPLLSFDQQRLWMENQLLPGVIYNVHGRRRIKGALDVAVFEASIRTILARHETLRTRFPATGGEPVQVVDEPDDDWRIRVEDLTGRGGGAGDPEETVRQLLDDELTTAFDLTTGPLIRCLLIRVGAEDHVLGVTMHHIVSDAWSIGLFVRELTALYEAGGDARRAGLSPAPVQYLDYAVWQRGRLTGDALEYQLGHWRRHLEGAPQAIALPTTERRTNALRAEAGQVVTTLTQEETAALHGLCQEHGVTSFMVLYAVFATVLSRWSGQTDFVVGVPVSGRNTSATDGLIGFFVNLLPLRADLSGDPTVVELLGRVRRAALDGYAHADAPMDELVRDLGVVRDPRRTPLFEVVLNVVGSPEAEDVSTLVVEPMETPSLFSRYDLTLTAQESAGTLRFKLDFPADRCEPAMGRALLRQMGTLLRTAAADPAARLLDVPVEEGTGVVAGLTAPAEPAAAHRAVARHAAATPSAIAVCDGAGRWTYAWLSAAVDRIADLLARRGVTAADRVGVVRRPSAAFVAVLAGAAKADVPCTVVASDDPAVTGPLGLTVVLDPGAVGEPAAGTLDLGTLLGAGPDAGAAVPPAAGTVPPDWAVERFAFGADERFVVLSSRPGHLASAVNSAFGAGATLVIPDCSFADGADALAAWLREAAVTVAYLDPPILRALSARSPAPDLPALRCVVLDNSGDLLPHDVEAVRAMAPGARCVSVHRPAADGRPLAWHEAAADLEVRTSPLRVPLGTPLPGRPIDLRRPSGQAAATGEAAEIWDGGERTGDLGRILPGGTVEYVGRSGVDPVHDPVQTVSAMFDVPGVRDAVVVESVDDDGAPVLVGYVAAARHELDTTAVHQRLKARLPDFLVPRQLFVLDALPRTPWGAYDLGALPRPAGDAGAGDDHVEPRTPMEQQLVEILQELLDIGRVGVYDSFFELGGFSMLATRLVSRIRETYGVELAVRDVFQAPTVDELAPLIVRAQGELSAPDDFEALLAEIEQGA